MPNGPAGTLLTLEHMAELTRQAQLHPITRETALTLLSTWRPQSIREGAERFRRWVRQHVNLLNAPLQILHEPWWMLEAIDQDAGRRRVWGNCADVAMLVATLGLAAGLTVRFVAILPPWEGGNGHVFPEILFDDGQWHNVDASTMRRPPEGWPRYELEL